MVEVDGLNMWSRYQAFYEFCQKPMHSVINIVGAPKNVQLELKEIVEKGLKDLTQRPNQPNNWCEPNHRIQLYDLPCDCPRVRRRQLN